MNLVLILQLIVAIGLLNVWLLRSKKSTDYRGKSASNLKEEFLAYGLPVWFFYLIGTLKIGAALALVAGIWMPELLPFASGLVMALMVGALLMHIKVKDPAKKSLPAVLMLIMSGGIFFLV
ncbi:MAG: DoxX family protein [Bdellovibrionota bacterium]